jgi:hypothetical protein
MLEKAFFEEGGFVVKKLIIVVTVAVFLVGVAFSTAYAREFFCQSGDVTCLVNAIKKANTTQRPDTIKLEAGVYTLRTVAETNDDGPNGLPSIKTEITIVGNGPNSTIIERDPTFGRPFDPGALGPQFRILYVTEAGNLTLDNLAIRGGVLFGSANDSGPGIFNRGATNITDSIIAQNIGIFGSGGGIFNVGGTLTVADSVISNNDVVEGFGGGITNFGGTSTIKTSTIRNNRADDNGGGVFNSGNMTIANSSIIGNLTIGGGGGIRNNGTLSVSNTTIAENSSSESDAGIRNAAGSLTIVNSTIANNLNDSQEGGFGTGGIGNSGGTVELRNTIVAANRAFSGLGPDCSGDIQSLGNNLIGTTRDCNINLLPSLT